MGFQKTIQDSLRFKGIGLHNGKDSELTIHPAPENYGIVFEKIIASNDKKIKIESNLNFVDSTQLCTNLAFQNHKIATVEHLLSALYALGIDNALIQIKGDEVPIMDGSSAPFVYSLLQIGIKEQTVLKKYLKILRKVEVELGDCYATLEPYDGFKLSFEIDFNNPFIQKTQRQYCLDLTHSSDEYENSVSHARTFGFVKDKPYLDKNNLAQGANFYNSIHIKEDSLSPNQALRNKAEFVQHKILDAVGDLSLCGFSLLASYNGYKAGHKLNNNLLHKLFENKKNYQIINPQ